MADIVVSKSIRASGDVREFDVDHVGPTSYVQAVVATNVGDKIRLGPGLNKGALNVIAGISDDGLNLVLAIPPASSGLPLLGNWLLKWYVISTMAQVAAAVDLSARHVRLRCITL